MSTRYADENAPLSQERYMSSPEYAELRGVNGSAVMSKASILTSGAKRSLLYFLQSLSLEEGGMRGVAEKLLAMFPERIGTRSMLANRIRPGVKLSRELVSEIRDEIQPDNCVHIADPEDSDACEREHERQRAALDAAPREADYYFALCTSELLEKTLVPFLIDLCINPRLVLSEPGVSLDTRAAVRDSADAVAALAHHDKLSRHEFAPAAIRFFHDICGALYEFQRRHREAALQTCAKTNTAKRVMDTLDACLTSRRMVLIEGASDAGKSTAAEAWCHAHRGEAIYVRLTGITSKTSFFRALGRALGLGGIYSRTSTEMQSRVEDMLIRSRLLVCIDEAAYMFPQSERIYSRPDLVDWCYACLANHGVPVAFIATSMFSERMRQAEKQVTWNSAQFRRRLYRFTTLAERPSPADIAAVVKHHLPTGADATLKMIAAYAATTQHPFTAITDTIADAKQIAAAAGHESITFKDVNEAIAEFRAVSELAKRQAFTAAPKKGRSGRDAVTPQPGCSEAAEAEREPRSQEDFTSRRLVAAEETQPRRETAPAFSEA